MPRFAEVIANITQLIAPLECTNLSQSSLPGSVILFLMKNGCFLSWSKGVFQKAVCSSPESPSPQKTTNLDRAWEFHGVTAKISHQTPLRIPQYHPEELWWHEERRALRNPQYRIESQPMNRCAIIWPASCVTASVPSFSPLHPSLRSMSFPTDGKASSR